MKIAVGGEFFDRLRESGSYYVDKTELLYELANDLDNAVTLFTRPRRFGKTLALSMMESFFDIRRDSRSVFSGLDIMKHEEFCNAWMNQYPVLSVTFKDVEGSSFSSAYGMLKNELADVCKKFPTCCGRRSATWIIMRTIIMLFLPVFSSEGAMR